MESFLERECRDRALLTIAEKIEGGRRLTLEDGVALLSTRDLLSVGRLANRAKRRVSGDRVFFVVNRQLNPTNICTVGCRFCDFARRKGEDGAYELTVEEAVASLDDEIREVHIVGGHHPTWPFETYVDLVRSIRQRFPEISIKAYTAGEIRHFARIARRSVEDVLRILREAGLDSLPGGAAEIFSERVRRELFPRKIGAEEWLDIHRTAHRLGISSNATMLYGHIETYAERIDHLLRLRHLQDETGGFLAFIPLAYQVGATRLVPEPASALEDLRTVAAARLVLDNVPHIKAYWVMIGLETTSVALHFGADDVDGTIGKERIAHAAQAESPAGLTRRRLRQLIREAGMVPVERDALYHVIDGGK